MELRTVALELALSALVVAGVWGGMRAWVDAHPQPVAHELEIVPERHDRAVAERLRARLATASRLTGVEIAYPELDAITFDGRATLPDHAAEAEAAVPMVAEALLRYPTGLRKRLLQRVVLTETLYDGEVGWGGMARCPHQQIDLSLEHLRQRTVHHEIGHLVYCDRKFPRKRWLAVGSVYTAPAAGEARDWERELRSAPWLWPEGFVTLYASRDVQEDAAELWEAFRTRPRETMRIAAEAPKIRDKLDLLLDFCAEVAPGWDPFAEREERAPGP